MGLIVIAASQPIDEPATPVAAAPVDEAVIVKALESTDDSDFDLMPSEDALKKIGHKLQHWTKKCVKHGGCRGTDNAILETWPETEILSNSQFQVLEDMDTVSAATMHLDLGTVDSTAHTDWVSGIIIYLKLHGFNLICIFF